MVLSRYLLILLLLSGVTSCSLIDSLIPSSETTKETESEEIQGAQHSTEAEKPLDTSEDSSNVSIENLDQEKGQVAEPGIEIIWQVPEEPTEGFVIHYGASPDNLDQEIKLSSDELTAEKHPKHGLVYKYFIKVANVEKLFVAISAYNDIGVSNMSETFEAK